MIKSFNVIRKLQRNYPIATRCKHIRLCPLLGVRGHAVAQLVEALRYKPEGRRFDF